MNKTKISVSLSYETVELLRELLEKNEFRNKSHIVEVAIIDLYKERVLYE